MEWSRGKRFAVGIITLMSLLVLPMGSASAQQRSQARLPLVRIGVLLDGPERRENVRAIFEKEIRELLRNDFRVRFPKAKRRIANDTAAGVKRELNRLLRDPQVDVILTLGLLSSNEAARRSRLRKPVFAPFVYDVQIQEIKRERDASGVRNLNYVTFPSRLDRNLRRFRDIVSFNTVAILLPQGIFDAIPQLRTNITRAITGLDLSFTLVPVGTTAESALAQLPATVQAVYVAPLRQLAPEEFNRLVQGLIARRLPSFSVWGKSEVEAGLLVALTIDTDLTMLARRVALNMELTLSGDDPSALPVTFTRRERVVLNMATARAIGVSPPWDLLTEAELLHREEVDVQRQLSLETAVAEAVNANLDVQAAGRFVAAGQENIREAVSFLLPQVDASSDGRIIDDDRAEAGGGANPERQLSGSLNLFQQIYDEPTWANLSIQRDVQVGREEERTITVLDVIFEAAVRYLNVLNAKTTEGIERQNLELTRVNLELARVRRQIGVARAAEVVRWENQIANNRITVINAFADVKQAEIALNRVLHRPLEEKFRTVEPSLKDPALMTSFAKIFPYVDNPQYFEIFRAFLTREGIEAAPELRVADARIRAQERALRSRRRAFWSPTVSLRGDVTVVERAGEGDSPGSFTLGPGQTVELPSDNFWNWEVGVTASLPLFTGGGRRARRDRARETLAQLRIEREATAERIAARIRTALYEAGASFANINLAIEGSRTARRNYELVLDGYRRGVVSILDLLDAQTESLNANLEAATSVYIYLINLMTVQRAVGQFDFFISADGRKAWFEKLDAFFRESGVTVTK